MIEDQNQQSERRLPSLCIDNFLIVLGELVRRKNATRNRYERQLFQTAIKVIQLVDEDVRAKQTKQD